MNANTEIIRAALDVAVANFGLKHLTRPAGSKVTGLDTMDGEAVREFLLAHDWEEVTDEANAKEVAAGKCRYFRAVISEQFTGLEGICLLRDLTDDEFANVRIVRGHHGEPEMQISGVAPRPTQIMHLFIGDFGNYPEGEYDIATAGLASWYPGRLTMPVPLNGAVVKFV